MGAVYTQLSLQERRKIEDWWHAKVPVVEMARAMKRHKSTIFREIKRCNVPGDFPTSTGQATDIISAMGTATSG